MTHAHAELAALAEYRPKHKVRVVTAAALFDGHDAAINIVRRILMDRGAEVIHLGHDRSVDEVVTAALQEDAQGIAISSYQGGHLEYFKYVIDSLRQRGGEHIQVFGGGGGVVVPAEIRELQAYGVARIYSPEDGQRMGLHGMIGEIVRRCDTDPSLHAPRTLDEIVGHGDAAWRALARLITALENGNADAGLVMALHAQSRSPARARAGGDRHRRRRQVQPDRRARPPPAPRPGRRPAHRADQHRPVAAQERRRAARRPDPHERDRPWARGRGSTCAASPPATPGTRSAAPLPDVVAAAKAAGFDLVIVETPGIGQGDAAIVPLVDVPLYVMTPEFGAASQLEKIDMLDFAELVAINKFDRKGAADALRDVAKQVQRNRGAFGERLEAMPVFGTIASRFNDDGVTALYQALKVRLHELGMPVKPGRLPSVDTRHSTHQTPLVPGARVRYLAEIAGTVRGYERRAREQAALAREVAAAPRGAAHAPRRRTRTARRPPKAIEPLVGAARGADGPGARGAPRVLAGAAAGLRGRRVRREGPRAGGAHALVHTSLSGTKIRKVVLPTVRGRRRAAEVAPARERAGVVPVHGGHLRVQAGGRGPDPDVRRRGRRLPDQPAVQAVSEGMPAKRLSTAFDSVTLYGQDPDPRPDIYGKVGNSGVSIATLDDMKALYSGFDLCDPATSVSMTINGPAPAILAMFMNAAIDQQLERFAAENGREPTDAEAAKIRACALASVRGTVQADILKEDQGQNTCIFSTDFSLKVMGDIAEYFVRHQVRNFYSVSISGYHIAEAGANPISQLAFTLANGFTYVEAYLARGMNIDDFAPNLSFFFSNGMDPEYTVLGRVARRIWAVAMRDRYGANERSQKLKYHVQTSGRSLHAQEIAFNDIRTTLQALVAIYDNCNSLHTNAYDEAITTPTEESVRRAMAIQLIINREWGLAKNENPNQGAFVIDELTELVEEAVLAEFERLADRGGVLGAMETGYQRSRIQEESMHYEMLKHTGEYPIVGVNTFRSPHGDPVPTTSSWRARPRRRSARSSRGSATSTSATRPRRRCSCAG